MQPSFIADKQPETPRPESLQPLLSEKVAILPNLGRRHSSSPSRSPSFTTSTFRSNSYATGGPMRRRRAESIFSFETGPNFSNTRQFHDLINMDQTNSYQVQVHAKMDKGFFRADQDWTCYRRNYFQVSSTFDIHGISYFAQGGGGHELPCLIRHANTHELFQVDFFSIGISARVTDHDKKVELVQHTPKRDKGPQVIPEARPVHPGGNLHLAAIGSNINIVTFERLQFKTATANNGKRRAAQQYYEIVINLYANVSHQKSPILVATCNSDPLVVRGRSPGHYSDSHSQRNSSSQQQHHMSTASSNNNNNSEANSSNSMAVNSNVSISSSSSSTSIVGNDRNRLVDKYQLSPPLPSQQQPQQQNKYTNLPNTPISEIGSYASYGNFPYQATPNFSPVVSSQSTPSSSNIPHYATNTLPSPNGQSYSCMNNEFNQQQSQMYHNNSNPNSSSPKPADKKPNSYWTQQQPEFSRLGGHREVAYGHSYMESTSDPYNHHHPIDPENYSIGLDAGRSQ